MRPPGPRPLPAVRSSSGPSSSMRSMSSSSSMELQDLNKPQQPRERFNWTHTRRAVNDDGPGRGSACGTLNLVHSGRRGAVFDAVHPSFVNRPCRTTITVWSTRAGRFVSLFGRRALHFVPTDLIVRWLGDQPLVSETATVIPARGATGLSMAIIAAPACSSGMRSAISSRRSSRPSVIIASMAG
jgi:hypothetical protein